jgi:hypothetical protein
MRADMAKVIVERPRRGSRWRFTPKGSRKRARLGDEGLPKREGMKRPWRSWTKDLNEHLGPLRRYLESQVGRPWNKVYSEICTHINRNSAVQDHVRDHVDDYVERNVLLIDGVPCAATGRFYGEPLAKHRWNRWYVCPRTGLLRRVERRAEKQRSKAAPRPVRVDDAHVCLRMDGGWRLVTVQKLPLDPTLSLDRDVLLNRAAMWMSKEEAVRAYGAAVYAVAWRPLKKKELRQYPIPVDLWK